VATTVTVHKLDIQREVIGAYKHLSRGVAQLTAAEKSDSELPETESSVITSDCTVFYVAGVWVPVEGVQREVRYKVVWPPKNVQRGEDRFEWVRLDDIGLGAQTKVLEFHQ